MTCLRQDSAAAKVTIAMRWWCWKVSCSWCIFSVYRRVDNVKLCQRGKSVFVCRMTCVVLTKNVGHAFGSYCTNQPHRLLLSNSVLIHLCWIRIRNYKMHAYHLAIIIVLKRIHKNEKLRDPYSTFVHQIINLNSSLVKHHLNENKSHLN